MSRRARPLAAVAIVCLGAIGLLDRPAADARAAGAGGAFVPVTPCRVFDSREMPGRTLAAGETVRIDLGDAGDCAVPESTIAVSVTLTAVGASDRGFLTAWPAGLDRPTTSSMNYGPGDTRANGSLVRLGDDLSIDVFTRARSDVVVDLNGYFVPAAGSVSAGRFVAVEPTRLLDTREAGARLAAGSETAITVPPDLHAGGIVAAAVTITLVDTADRTFATAYPLGAERPVASSVNADAAGQVRAATVIVPTSGRQFAVFARAATDLVVDISAVVTADDAPPSTTGLFVPIDPERIVDTREDGPAVYENGTREFALPFAASLAAVNVTAVRPAARGFWTAFPAGNPRPFVSSLNASGGGEIVSNMAIVPAADRGIAVFGRRTSDVVVDATGYFVGEPVPSPLDVPPNVPPPDRRVVIIGDSAMTGLRTNGALDGLRGANFETYLQTCRRLVFPSCSVLRRSAPPTALEVLRLQVAPARSERDVLVIATGYNDWFGRFATAGQGVDDLGAIMSEARAKGFRTVVWASLRSTEYGSPPGSSQSGFSDNADINRAVRQEAAQRYPELVVWDRDLYTIDAPSWYYGDGVHQTPTGSWGIADWISRHVAALDGRPCPMPWFAGQPVEAPCPHPDGLAAQRGGVPDVRRLYGLG